MLSIKTDRDDKEKPERVREQDSRQRGVEQLCRFPKTLLTSLARCIDVSRYHWFVGVYYNNDLKVFLPHQNNTITIRTSDVCRSKRPSNAFYDKRVVAVLVAPFYLLFKIPIFLIWAFRLLVTGLVMILSWFWRIRSPRDEGRGLWVDLKYLYCGLGDTTFLVRPLFFQTLELQRGQRTFLNHSVPETARESRSYHSVWVVVRISHDSYD